MGEGGERRTYVGNTSPLRGLLDWVFLWCCRAEDNVSVSALVRVRMGNRGGPARPLVNGVEGDSIEDVATRWSSDELVVAMDSSASADDNGSSRKIGRMVS